MALKNSLMSADFRWMEILLFHDWALADVGNKLMTRATVSNATARLKLK